jgi:hypothetical protein
MFFLILSVKFLVIGIPIRSSAGERLFEGEEEEGKYPPHCKNLNVY